MPFSSHQQELDFLNQLGFVTNPLNSSSHSLEEIWKVATNLEKEKESLPYPIDGLVVKLDDIDLYDKLGVVGKTPRGWCAIKFKAQEVTTRITEVAWQVGRTGKVTPVAQLEPVELGGTTVKRATLHNYKEFLDKNLHYLDTLVIRKAGEIIPEVIQVLENLRVQNSSQIFESPQNCPSCQQQLTTSQTDVDLICKNPDCRAQVIGRLSYYTQRNMANITGLSEKQIEKFVDLFNVLDIPDLYNLPFGEISELEGFGSKSVENLQTSVQNSREINDYKFLSGLGIDGIGPEVAKLICQLLQQSQIPSSQIAEK